MLSVPLNPSAAVEPVSDACTTLLLGATKKLSCWLAGLTSTPNVRVTATEPVDVIPPNRPPAGTVQVGETGLAEDLDRVGGGQGLGPGDLEQVVVAIGRCR